MHFASVVIQIFAERFAHYPGKVQLMRTIFQSAGGSDVCGAGGASGALAHDAVPSSTANATIVFTRFIFSYEQAFMGDLVRFWYAALFLFSSAYTLLEEGHVRVDILYAGFSERAKAWTNTIGSLALGIPLCWVILTLSLWGKSNLINAPLLSFEVTQSGYGMYVKYLMAGFLLVYAITMLVQFASVFLASAETLLRNPDPAPDGETDKAL